MEAFVKELQAVAAALRQEADRLAADRRQDEADLTKIRANVYEVCATVGTVACKTAGPEAREAFYLKKLAHGAGNGPGPRQHPTGGGGRTETGGAGGRTAALSRP